MGVYLGSNLVGTGSTHTIEVESTDIENALLMGTITEYSNSTISSIGRYAFVSCTSLTSVDLPNVTSIEDYAFQYCSSLTSINLPKINIVGSYAFQYCTSLISIDLPQAVSIEYYAFAYCSSLALVNLPQVSYIRGSAFRSCHYLISVNLSGVSAVPTLGANVFFSTPISGYSTYAGQYGSIYVPASLYSSFLTAANWSIYSSRIVSV